MMQPPSYSEATTQEVPKFCWRCGKPIQVNVSTNCADCGASVFLPVLQQPSLTNVFKETASPAVPGYGFLETSYTYAGTYSYEDTLVRQIDNRLVIDFEKVSICPCQTTGLRPGVKEDVPHHLRERGISPSEWSTWMEDLQSIQSKSPSIGGCLCLFCFPGLIVQCMLCAIFCPTSADQPLACLPCFYGDWYSDLRKWMEQVNNRLEGYGMYAKLTTYKPFGAAPRSALYNQRVSGKDGGYEMSFLEIAITESESRKLKIESWDHGVNDGCTSGIGRCL